MSIYGDQACKSNVHNLGHYKKIVQINGPLWATSVFNYENFNGDFKNLFHGTQKVEKQVLKAVSIVQNLPELAERL